jgi:hypothetical protein
MAVLLLGIALRFLPLGLPFALTKWGGSVLWAGMIYLLFAAFLPRRGVWTVALMAGVFATLVELSRLYHSPGLDAFRLTLAGALLLGRVFESLHFVCYWGGILAVAGLEWVLFRRRAQLR